VRDIWLAQKWQTEAMAGLLEDRIPFFIADGRIMILKLQTFIIVHFFVTKQPIFFVCLCPVSPPFLYNASMNQISVPDGKQATGSSKQKIGDYLQDYILS
jgi:hypothetical protein